MQLTCNQQILGSSPSGSLNIFYLCDSLTSTYKGLNKGNGRKYRKEQYHKDKLKFTIS